MTPTPSPAAQIDMDALEKLALNATPGPWALWGRADPSQTISAKECFVAQTLAGNDECNAAYLSAVDPQTVLELIRMARNGTDHVEPPLTMVAPEGWALVPIVPSDAMIEEICFCHAQGVWPDDYGNYAQGIRRSNAKQGYSSMLAAAPKPAGQAAQKGD